MFQKINKFFLAVILKIIRLYQHTLSPDQGWLRIYYPHGFCRYYPHCSEYGYRALQKHGLLGGSYRAVGRILRCHPWAKGGHDPI